MSPSASERLAARRAARRAERSKKPRILVILGLLAVAWIGINVILPAFMGMGSDFQSVIDGLASDNPNRRLRAQEAVGEMVLKNPLQRNIAADAFLWGPEVARVPVHTLLVRSIPRKEELQNLLSERLEKASKEERRAAIPVVVEQAPRTPTASRWIEAAARDSDVQARCWGLEHLHVSNELLPLMLEGLASENLAVQSSAIAGAGNGWVALKSQDLLEAVTTGLSEAHDPETNVRTIELLHSVSRHPELGQVPAGIESDLERLAQSEDRKVRGWATLLLQTLRE